MSTLTPNKFLVLPVVGGNVSSWGPILNSDYTALDLILGGVLPLDVAGSSNVTLDASQAKNLAYQLSGALTGAISVIFPTGGGFYLVQNGTSGTHALTLITSAVSAVGVVAPQDGNTYLYYTDGTTFFNLSADAKSLQGIPVKSGTPADGQILTYVSADGEWEAKTNAPPFPSGTLLCFPQASAPTGWTQNNTFNDAVMRLVNSGSTGGAIGGSWTISGVTIGGTSITQAQLPNCSFTVGDSGHSHPLDGYTVSGSGPANNNVGAGSNTSATNTGNATTGITVSSGGSGSTHTHSFASDATWRMAYVNAIVCSKD